MLSCLAMDNEYMRQYMARRRARRREDLLMLAGGQCVKCGLKDDLEFDHRDPTKKRFVLSGAGLDGPWASVLIELKKCDLLCCECHRVKTKQNGERGGGHNRIEPRCGTVHGYLTGRCRCRDCRFAKAMYVARQIEYHDLVKAPQGWKRGVILP